MEKELDVSHIIINHKKNNTLIEINGEYELVGFFPDDNSMNMVIVLRKRD